LRGSWTRSCPSA